MVDLTQITLEEITSSSESKGYELHMEERIPTEMGVEETIVSILIKRQERLVEGVPVLLTKNKVNYEKLKELIDEYEVWNGFGYLGKFALTHLNNAELRELVQYCHRRLKPHANLSSLNEAFFEHSITKEQEEWNVIGAPPYSALEEKYKLYCR